MPATSKTGIRVETSPDAEFEVVVGSVYRYGLAKDDESGTASSARTLARGSKGWVEVAMLAALLWRAQNSEDERSEYQMGQLVRGYQKIIKTNGGRKNDEGEMAAVW